jgi:LDH2 family malate/lactate/ureidoglycolate dehydrogenase
VAADRAYTPEQLRGFCEGVCLALGAPADIASEVAGHLVRSNLAGHDSHGVLRIPQYVADAERGDLSPAERCVLLHDRGATALFDARRGFGHHSTRLALDHCADQAARTGIAAAAVRHSTHIGRLGDYTERAAARGIVAILTVGSAGLDVGSVAAFGSRQRFLATNPWSIAIPTQSGPPFLFDAATSAMAEGKVRLARAKAVELPPGTIIDARGHPSQAPDDFYNGGALLPVGGDLAGHKGFGLGLAAALLGGLAMIADPEPTTAGTTAAGTLDRRPEHWAAGVFAVAIHPGHFGDETAYRTLVSHVLQAARDLEPVAAERVLTAGEPEELSRGRRRDSIPVPPAVAEQLEEIGRRFGVPLQQSR